MMVVWSPVVTKFFEDVKNAEKVPDEFFLTILKYIENMRTTDDFLDVLAGLNEASTVQSALPERHGSKNFNLSKKLEDTN